MIIRHNIMDWRLMGVLVALVGVLGRAPAKDPVEGRAGELGSAQFQQLHRKLVRMSREKVWSIPWKLSVREAREQAARENKPLFLWISSNGGTHPLGPC